LIAGTKTKLRPVRAECYGATRPQQGRAANEDAFWIGGSRRVGAGASWPGDAGAEWKIIARPPVVALCDGAGKAQLAAQKALRLFGKLYREAEPEAIERFPTWAGWVRVLDSALLGGAQSTFLAAAVIGDRVVGACVGDSRAYLIDREGRASIVAGAGGQVKAGSGREWAQLGAGAVGRALGFANAATKYRLGSGRAQPVPIHLRLQPRDVLLLLSDGAWSPLSLERLHRAVVGAALKHFSEVPQAVLDAACRTGRADDMTAVAVRVMR